MLSRSRSFRLILSIALFFAIAGGATMSFGASDVTTPKAIPYMTSNVATNLNAPFAIAIDNNGNVYVGENTLTSNGSAVVKKIDAVTGLVTVFAGGAAKAAAGSSPCTTPDTTVLGGGNVLGDGCPATQSFLGGSNGGVHALAVWNNYLYIEDYGGYYIHRVNLANNIIELVGGNGSSSAVWPGDGPVKTGTTYLSLFKPPSGMAIDPLNGNVYFAAGGTTAPTIRMISSDTATCQNAISGSFAAPCVITVVNYVGQTGTPAYVCADPAATLTAKTATVYYPTGLAFDADRNLYIAENKCSTIRKLTKNPTTNMVDGNSTFTTLLGNNTAPAASASPSWYNTSGTLGAIGPIRSVASAGGNDLYVSTSVGMYFYDSATGWAHRIMADTVGTCGTTPNAGPPTYAGCPAPWAAINNASQGGQIAVDKAGNLYVTDIGNNTVVKAALGTDFIGTAPKLSVNANSPATQTVLVHGPVAMTAPTTSAPFNAVVGTTCTTYSAGDLGKDCAVTLTYTPTALGVQTGNLAIDATNLPLAGQGSNNAVMVSPVPGSTLINTSANFTWSSSTGAAVYWIWVGTTPGGMELYNQGQGLNTSQTITGLPTDGSFIYVRLFTMAPDGTWQWNDYVYKTATPTKAAMISPAAASTLSGKTVTFTWNPGGAAQQYWIWAGTTSGAMDLYSQGQALNTTATISNLPTTGQVYVRLFTMLSGAWQYNDYQYTAAAPTKAAMTSPAANSTLPGSSATFTWAPGLSAQQYWLWIGTTVGSMDLYAQGQSLNTTATVNGLPTNGAPVYVRLFTMMQNGTWSSTDYTYTAASPSAAVMLTPSNNSTFAGSSATFTWTQGNGAIQYWMWAGTMPASQSDTDPARFNYFHSGLGLDTSVTVTGLPTDGSTIYVRLFTMMQDGTWQWSDYTYTAGQQQ